MPRLRLGIVRAGGVERHLHQRSAPARSPCSSRAYDARPYAAADGRLRIIASNAAKAASYSPSSRCASPMTPSFQASAGSIALRLLGGGDGVPEAVLRGEHRAEHPLRLVARAGGDRGAQGAFRLDRQAAVAGRAGLAQQRVGEPCGRDAVAGLVRDPALERGDGRRETVARRRRAARRSRRERHRGMGARRPRAPRIHAGGDKRAHDHGDPRSQFLQRRHARLRSGSGSTPESTRIDSEVRGIARHDSGVGSRRLRSRARHYRLPARGTPR